MIEQNSDEPSELDIEHQILPTTPTPAGQAVEAAVDRLMQAIVRNGVITSEYRLSVAAAFRAELAALQAQPADAFAHLRATTEDLAIYQAIAQPVGRDKHWHDTAWARGHAMGMTANQDIATSATKALKAEQAAHMETNRMMTDALMQAESSIVQPGQPSGFRRDAVTVNLMRLANLDKHTARSIADAAFEAQPGQAEPVGCVAKDGFTILYFQEHPLPFETDLYTAPVPASPLEVAPVTDVDEYLCRAWGETDKPAAAIVSGLDGVRRFLIDQWLGDENDSDLPSIMADIDDAFADEREWSAEFEIGGISVSPVCDVGQRKASRVPVAAVAKLRVYMDRHDMGQSLAPNEPYKVAIAHAKKTADELPLGEYDLYLSAAVPAGAGGSAIAQPVQPTIEAVQGDAERMDWMARHFFTHRWNGVIDSGSQTHWGVAGDFRHTAHHMVGNTFREAIDAAITAKDAK